MFICLQVLPGNSAPLSTTPYELLRPFNARYVRINPVTWNVWISLRFEVMGCRV